MGEARRRRAVLSELLRDKQCVFCGGAKRAIQIDHVPPRIAFANKLRPQGLEFPACSTCNQGTRDIDQIVGLLSRLTLDETPLGERADLEKLVSAFRNNYPNVIKEIQFNKLGAVTRKRARRYFPDTADVTMATGPIVGAVIGKFGAKLGFGLHYRCTGRVVPSEGAAAVWLLTNESLVNNEFPSELVAAFPEFQALRQGMFDTSKQFGYASMTVNGGPDTIHIAYFRLSFFLVIYVAERDAATRLEKLDYPPEDFQRPGDWKIPF